MKSNGPIFQLMKKRIEKQKEYVQTYFTKEETVLDCGCGFGRQSFMLGKDGYEIVGIDSSKVFIDIARRLFLKRNLKGEFIYVSIFDFKPEPKFKQILLFDVYEHIEPKVRSKFIEHIAKDLCQENAYIIVTFPFTGSFRNKNKILNILKKYSYGRYLNKDEHPYYIPNKKSFEKRVGRYFSIINQKIIEGTLFFTLKLK
jgi:2-polyprenyl-3-methyl-5-hydroxy-6-metoxy-1,4-benzoquinol methylase